MSESSIYRKILEESIFKKKNTRTGYEPTVHITTWVYHVTAKMRDEIDLLLSFSEIKNYLTNLVQIQMQTQIHPTLVTRYHPL